jgi:hypothetical protein
LESGFDVYSGSEQPTIPIYLNASKRLSSKRISTKIQLGAGYGIAYKPNSAQFLNWNQRVVSSKGGFYGQAIATIMTGNHFGIDMGIIFQKKSLDWVIDNIEESTGTDRIINRRLIFGVSMGI